MVSNELGGLRRSAAATTFGPGAIVDFRAGEATISAVIAGLEEWDANFPPAGMLHPQAIREERLQKKLNVSGFRLPPVRDPNEYADTSKALVAVRFPSWLQCPQCDRIARASKWNREMGRPGRICAKCTDKAPSKRNVYVIPVRFAMACEAGHLDEFPWHSWVRHKEGCPNNPDGFLRLRSEQPGLEGLILSCPKCKARRSMEGIFLIENWQRFSDCRGRRPWLSGPDETCSHKRRVVQRGASNLYFPVVESALSIPPWSDRLQEALGVYWSPIVDAEPAERAARIRHLVQHELKGFVGELKLTPERLAEEVDRRLGERERIDTRDLRGAEYQHFTRNVEVKWPDREFEIRPEGVPPGLRRWFSRLVRATRLREVRALKGFTRVQPPNDSGDPKMAPLSLAPQPDWLPAIEVRGEGIFLEFDHGALSGWENQADVVGRAAEIDQRWVAEWSARYGAGSAPPRSITPRFLLVHSFAHALMRQLTLDCGYSSTALRERLYVSSGAAAMAGVLIYTATTDNDGTLGGLQREGHPDRIERTVQAALRSQTWCSSDPLCIENALGTADGLSLAACHSCLLAPETSCEEFNRFLDRAMLVGTPKDPGIGFFAGLLSTAS